MMPVLKIFSSGQWHDPIRIIGNKKALQELIINLQSAIDLGESESEFLESDGEGYSVISKLLDSDFNSPNWDSLPTHYTNEIAREMDKDKWNNLSKIN